ncbi:c-type cytochrome [Microvirga vignae]|nr:cytochrome c [Microvirga vignae]
MLFSAEPRLEQGFAGALKPDWAAMLEHSTTLPLSAIALLMLLAGSRGSGVERGRVLLEANCAGCHAVGRADASPMPAAPPLRDLHQRYPVESLEEALAEGLTTGHPGKPVLRFEVREIEDMIEYLKSLEH